MMKEYLTVALQNGIYSYPKVQALPIADEDDAGVARVAEQPALQFIKVWEHVPASRKFVKDPMAAENERHKVPVLVQKLEVWGNPNLPILDAYVCAESGVQDALACQEWSVLKDNLQVWTVGVSDVSGCLALTNPVQAKPQLGPLGLLEPGCPGLMLEDHLQSLGWELVARRGPHKHVDDVKTYVMNAGKSNKPYVSMHLGVR